jgi:hypothetical protein
MAVPSGLIGQGRHAWLQVASRFWGKADKARAPTGGYYGHPVLLVRLSEHPLDGQRIARLGDDLVYLHNVVCGDLQAKT